MEKAPEAYIFVAEVDLLCVEGMEYYEKLKKCGVKAKLYLYKGVPHMTLNMTRVLDAARQMVKDIASTLKEVFDVR